MNFQPLKDFLDGYLPMLGVPGSDTIIYRNHEELFRYSAGFDSLSQRTPVRTDALYNIYSCTKPITGIAAAQLIERGEIVITDPLYAYFPEYRDVLVKVKDENGNVIDERKPKRPILIRDLLSMTAGLNYNTKCESITRVVDETDGRAPTLDVCRALANEALEFDPGERYLYSLCLDVMGGVIELVSGMRFSDYVRENIFEPLGMKNSSFRVTEEIRSRMATQYFYDEKTHLPVEMESDKCVYRFGTEYDSAGAGIVSCVDDYILFADALAMGGVGKSGERIISKFTLNRMRENLLDPDQLKTFSTGKNIAYGYGYGMKMNLNPKIAGDIAPIGELSCDGAKLSYFSADLESGISVFHAEHMGGVHNIVIPRLRNLVYSCIGE